MKLPIYMDHHATTPTDPRVFEAMAPYFTEHFGNAASRTHAFGWKAEKAVEHARHQVARLIGARAKEIVFTSGATESDNLAIKGVAAAYRDKGDHIITVVTEHKAVLDSCHRLEAQGFRVTYLPVQADGRVDLDDLRGALTDRTILISVMAANGEIGVLQPLPEIGEIARAHGVLFHTDAVQAVGKIAFDVEAAQVDLASITAHKMYGPKGVGALYVRQRHPRVRLTAMVDGGGQEHGMRSGTLNVPGIVGFGRTAEICQAEMAAEGRRLVALRARVLEGLYRNLDGVHVNGSLDDRLPNNLNVGFTGVEGGAVLMGMSDVAMSSSSACSSGSAEASYVLTALGVDAAVARGSVRLGLGRSNDVEQADYVVEQLTRVVTRLREMSPVYEQADKDYTAEAP